MLSCLVPPLFLAVAILGMVEFCVFLMQEYYEDYNKEKKDVFGAVHFALFYTALLNAFQSMILSYAVRRVSRKMWVQTEALELNHYVEIREEFDRVQTELGALKAGAKSSGSSTSGSDDDKGEGNSRWAVAPDERGLRGFIRAVVDRIRYPRLKSRYNELLVQVRFHELRVHFLKAYNLPLKLKIADYLLRSEQTVLIKLVHVSSSAWLLLTASINLLYFVLGIVGTKTGDPGMVGVTLIYVFFCCLFIFIVLALILRKKVRNIFRQIMHRRELWQVQEDAEEKERLAAQQMGLFWGSSPKLIIAAIQFMQFGYAVALATVIMFWEQISDGGVSMIWYWVAIFVCYSLFVAVAAQVIPQYTLCTSLGQLVDKKRLSESVAIFHLEEAKRQRREEIFLRATMDGTLRLAPAPTALVPSARDSEMSSSRHDSIDGTTPFTVPSDSIASDRSAGAVSIADLVSVNTDSLRTTLPDSERDALAARLAKRRDRRKRMKSVSDGVAFMASLGNDSTPAERASRHGQMPLAFANTHVATRAKDDSVVSTKKSEGSSFEASDSSLAQQEPLQAGDTTHQHLLERRRSRRGRMKTLSDGVARMAAMNADEPASKPPRLGMVRENSERIADLVFADTKTLRESLASNELEKLSERDLRRSDRKKSSSDGVKEMRNKPEKEGAEPKFGLRKGRRQKAVSDGVAAMANMPTSGFFAKNTALKLNPAVKVANPIATPKSENEDEFERSEKDIDNASMRSLASDDDHSDFDDVPEADPNMMKLMTVEVVDHKASFWEKSRNYYMSKRYPIISNVFGTMIAFFIVGSRIERFLHTENIVSEEWISFDFSETITFWALTGWLSLFLIMDIGVFFSFGPYHMQHALRARKVWVAALLDFVLCSVCIIVFFVAEHQRCCSPSDNYDYRFLKEYDEYSETNQPSSVYGEEKGYVEKKMLLPAPCDCQTFGSRLYGGLGTVEPYTSLIALRLFRFWLSSRIVKFLDTRRGEGITKEEARQLAADNENLDPFDVADDPQKSHSGHDDHGGHDHHGHHGEEKGTIAELWEAAVGKHPEIVAKYGEFSGELLQAMLGIPILDSPDPYAQSGMITEHKGGVLDPTKETYLIDDQFAKLPCRAQEIIMAGKLGKAVISVPDNTKRESTFTIPEHVHGEDAVSAEDATFRFEVATEPLTQELDMTVSAFDAPNARLVRSMRRCERKLIPILDQWTVVDVVMTRFEIVYFDAVGVDDNIPDDSVFEALAATKGGKGLRLCDVATGRRVVGHLSLSEITSAYVEREMPTENATEEMGIPETDIVRKAEFWKHKPDSVGFNRREFWHKIKQDRLVVQTEHGNTLYLRFFADLEDAQNHPEHYATDNEIEGELYKNNAFQWVQSISRMCGPEQLKQSLPHFGEDTNDELRDFLIVHRNETEQKGHRRGLSRGFSSAVRLDQLAVHHAEPSRPGFSRRASSFGETFIGGLSVPRRPSSHRRSASQQIDTTGGAVPSIMHEGEAELPSSPPRQKALRRAVSMGSSEAGKKKDVSVDEIV